MIRITAFVLALMVPGFASAGCAVGETEFVSCTLKDGKKKLETCRGEARASYWFGSPAGKADLALTVQDTQFEHTPWSGMGATIWEELAFRNSDVTYTVFGAIDRFYPEEEGGEVEVFVSAGIVVSQAGKELARLECDPGSVSFNW